MAVPAPNWSLSIDSGANLTGEELLRTLASQHNRLIATWESFSVRQWQTTSRNREWSVHDTARHVADVIEVIAAQVRKEPAPHQRVEFDPNTTPDLWLAGSVDESPARTIERYGVAASALRKGVAERIEDGDTGTSFTPYGPAHWTMSVVHGFWDAWLHERDVNLPLEISTTTTAEEQRLAALYGLFMALVPSRMMATAFETVICFTGPVPGAVAAVHDNGLITARECQQVDTELTGDRCTVVDSLSGRGDEITNVLPGAPDLLGVLAGNLAS